MGLFSRRVFPILQLARMALVFTAISNALCELFLWTAQHDNTPYVPTNHGAAQALTAQSSANLAA